jgi:ketosteroid isomerase-like protein
MKFHTKIAILSVCLLSMRSVLPAQIFSLHPVPADNESKRVANTISEMFNSLRTDDVATFDSVTEPQLIIFDAGVRFTRESMLYVIKGQHAAGHSISWSVTEPDVHISGDTAWIDYVNIGSLTSGSSTQPLTWLESAVLHKSEGRWKIQFLHSTLVPAKTHTTSPNN